MGNHLPYWYCTLKRSVFWAKSFLSLIVKLYIYNANIYLVSESVVTIYPHDNTIHISTEFLLARNNSYCYDPLISTLFPEHALWSLSRWCQSHTLVKLEAQRLCDCVTHGGPRGVLREVCSFAWAFNSRLSHVRICLLSAYRKRTHFVRKADYTFPGLVIALCLRNTWFSHDVDMVT